MAKKISTVLKIAVIRKKYVLSCDCPRFAAGSHANTYFFAVSLLIVVILLFFVLRFFYKISEKRGCIMQAFRALQVLKEF